MSLAFKNAINTAALKACWPTPIFNNIPITDMLFDPSKKESKFKDFQKSTKNIGNKTIDFIFSICEYYGLKLETAEASILSLIKYLEKPTNNKYDYNLTVLTIIFLCSKMFDLKHMPLSILHEITEHSYNNALVLSCENHLLRSLNYDLYLRNAMLSDKVGLFLECIKNYYDEKDFLFISKTTGNFIKMLYIDMKLIKNVQFNLLAVALIQAVILISSLEEGSNPVNLKLAALTGYSVNEITDTGKKILKNVLGHEAYKMFNF